MKLYYKHNETGEIILTLGNLRQIKTDITENNPFGYSVVTDYISPDKKLGCGVLTFCVSYSHLKKNYTKIKKSEVLKLYSNFKQCFNNDTAKDIAVKHNKNNLYELLELYY